MKINSTIRENDPQATREPTSIFLMLSGKNLFSYSAGKQESTRSCGEVVDAITAEVVV